MNAEPEAVAKVEGDRWKDTFCPFCENVVITVVNWISNDPTFDFACGTEQLPGGFVRSKECLEAQLAAQATLIRETAEVVRENEELLKFAAERANDDCPGLMMTECTCAGCQIQRISSKLLPKTTALLPRLEAAARRSHDRHSGPKSNHNHPG